MRAKLTGTVLKGIVASKIKISPFDSKEKKEQVSHNVSIERSHKSKEEKKEKKEKEKEREKEKEKEKKEAKKLKKRNKLLEDSISKELVQKCDSLEQVNASIRKDLNILRLKFNNHHNEIDDVKECVGNWYVKMLAFFPKRKQR